MNGFLYDMASQLVREYGNNLEDLAIVFPNKRAGLFFSRSVAQCIGKPSWSPEIWSIEEFIVNLSGRRKADRLTLILDLYKIHKEVTGFDEEFDRFYFWGEILLNDFEEVDKYLVDAKDIFSMIRDLKEIDATFFYLTDEQKEVIKNFWSNLGGRDSEHKEGFIRFWKSVYPVYRRFGEFLTGQDYSYAGRLYRQVAAKIAEPGYAWNGKKIIFAGFNALNAAEEKILKWFMENAGAGIFWDVDGWYINKPYHEAGLFFRRYLNDPVFAPTFPKIMPSKIPGDFQHIEVIAASSETSQARWAGQKLNELSENKKHFNPEKTVIILPDEAMAGQVIQSLPDSIQKVNVTMGYPVRNSPFFSFIEMVIELHENRKDSTRGSWFNHRYVLPILQHPLVDNLTGPVNRELVARIRERNMLMVHHSGFSGSSFLEEIFMPAIGGSGFLDFLIGLVSKIGNSMETEISPFEKEIHFYLHKLLSRLKDLFLEKNMLLSIGALRRLFRQFSRMERVSYVGEPLEGLQVMGIMESRNLDFEHVIFLDANEGVFPATNSQNTFIPYSVRKAFGMPEFHHTDSINSYLFYRLLHHAKNVFLVYNSGDTGLRTGEPSRFIQQIRYSEGFNIKEKTIINPISVTAGKSLVVEKTSGVLENLYRYLSPLAGGQGRHLTPSAINLYLDCPLSFYYRYVLDVKEPEEVKADFDALIFGNILHLALEKLYKPVSSSGNLLMPRAIGDLFHHLDAIITEAFAGHFGVTDPADFSFTGRNLVGREIVKKVLKRILKVDEAYAPFYIRGTELRINYPMTIQVNGATQTVNMKGIIDRIDDKDGTVRIVDYKSGRDSTEFKGITWLFGLDRDKRNKAVLQTLFYAMVTGEQTGNMPLPCLYNAGELFREDFDPVIKLAGRPVQPGQDMADIIQEFKIHLVRLIEEIFDPAIPFTHRDKKGNCPVCARNGLPSVIL